MKNLFILMVLFLLSCKPTSTKEVKLPTLEKATVVSYKNLDVKAFNDAIQNTDNVILDVRTPEEIADGKIDNAIELNFYDDDFSDRLLAMDKDKEYIVYCKGGGRSAKTARLMIKNGFEKVNNLEGGYKAWKKDLD